MPLPPDHLTTEPLARDSSSAGANDRTFSLLVLRDGESSTYPLANDGRILIGRSPQAGVRIDDTSISREHAALELGARITIEDLGSANGTRVRDVPLAPRSPVEVFPDDIIDLGSVLLVVQYRRLEQRLRRSSAPAFFDLRVEEECELAARGEGCFAAVTLEVDASLGSHAVQLLLASELDREDLLTSRSAGWYELLLLDVSAEEAGERVSQICKLLAARGSSVRTRLRHCPSAGSSPAELFGKPGPERAVRDKLGRRAPFVVRDEAMQRVCRLLERIADSELGVILLGETGVGKELCAELIHAASPRARHPLVRFNCAALSETLLESELFGYERGAFTGATSDKPGLLETANGGSVFLDEVGDMPLSTQVKLLRVFESKEVLRLGARAPRPIDVRVIAATNKDLAELVTGGLFREDLFYRLNGISVLVPPLRERPEDIEPLSQHFLQRFTQPSQGEKRISRAGIAWLRAHRWPGNVRELRNVIERALILCDGSEIEPRHLPLGAPGARAFEAAANPATAQPGLRDEVRALERTRLEGALRECHGNQRRAAVLLGISRGAFLRRLEQLDIRRPRRGN